MSIIDYNKLIALHLSGEISREDEQTLQQWLAAAPENRETFAKLEKVWRAYQPREPDEIPDRELVWSRLEQNLQLRSASPSPALLHADHPVTKKSWFSDNYFRAGLLAAAAVALFFVYTTLQSPATWQTYATGYAQTETLELPDRSVVRLNAGSEIRFVREFADSVRLVAMQGEAFFEVVPGTRPFVVKTPHAEIRVMGTRFDVFARGEKTEVIVAEGLVQLSAVTAMNGGRVLLHANEKSGVRANHAPTPAEAVDADYLIGWLHNRFVFHKTPLAEAVAEIERRHAVRIRLMDEALGNLTMSGAFEDRSTDSTLQAFCLALNLTVVREGDTYLIFRQD